MKVYVFLFLLIFTACKDNKDQRHFATVSNFNVVANAMDDNEPVKIVFCSSGGDVNETKDYLIQFIVVRQKTLDTLNVLSDRSDNIAKGDGNKVFYFKSFTKGEVEQLQNFSKMIEIAKHPEISKTLNLFDLIMVAQDEKFLKLQENRHPTVMGYLQESKFE